MPKVTKAVEYALRAWRKIEQYKNISLKEAIKRGFVKEKYGKYVVTAKGEKAKPSMTNR